MTPYMTPPMSRVARFITTSIDGGNTFGGQTYLNEPNQVYDAITGQPMIWVRSLWIIFRRRLGWTEFLRKGLRKDWRSSTGGFMRHGAATKTAGAPGNETLNILTSSTTYSVVPRIISSTQGVVSTPEDIVNPAQNMGSTIGVVPAFQYIDVTFDRGIIPSSLTASDIDIQYRNDSTPGSQPPTDDISDLISSITPLNMSKVGESQSSTATEFRIALSAPQTAVGTYSYYILPAVSDGYEYYGLGGASSTVLTASSAPRMP